MAINTTAIDCVGKSAGLSGVQSEEFHRATEEHHLLWRLAESPSIWVERGPVLEPLKTHRSWLVEQFGSADPLVVVQGRLSGTTKEQLDLQDSLDLAVAEGRLGTVRPMNCLESHLLSRQVELSGVSTLREFSAYVLRKGGELKVYFMSGPNETPPNDKRLRPKISEDLAEGWSLYRHIHNHTAGDHVAPLASPSSADARYGSGLGEYAPEAFVVLDGVRAAEIGYKELASFMLDWKVESNHRNAADAGSRLRRSPARLIAHR